jgi:hypothetical protein
MAVASNGRSRALPPAAFVGNGARIAIVTVSGIVLEETAPGFVTEVIRAGVVIVTIHRTAHALPGIAVIGDSARIAVETLGSRQGRLLAAQIPLACILGATIAIVAQLLQFPFDQSGFVNGPVTIIIQAVANLLLRGERIARRETVGAAHPLAQAAAKLVGHFTRRPQGQLHRLLGAGTDPRIGNTLLRGNTVNRRRIGTRKAPGAIVVHHALAAAKTPLSPIIDANVVRSGGPLTVSGSRTGQTEVGVVGNADEDHIRSRPRNLLAGPSRSTLTLALDGADVLTHVANAPAGKAILIARAGVQKAPLPGGTLRSQGILNGDVEDQIQNIICRQQVGGRNKFLGRFQVEQVSTTLIVAILVQRHGAARRTTAANREQTSHHHLPKSHLPLPNGYMTWNPAIVPPIQRVCDALEQPI